VPSTNEAKKIWNEQYDWISKGEEWSADWGGSENQWNYSLYPRIKNLIANAKVGLEIAPGFGRWTDYLKQSFETLHLVDVSEHCIDACKKRFADEKNFYFHVNNGYTLETIESNSIDFAFSFDSLVHVEQDVINSYLKELARVLRKNGSAFIHHSNLGAFSKYISFQKLFRRGRIYLVKMGVFDDLQSGYRTQSVSADGVLRFSREINLICESQELINWKTKNCIDCISTFRKSGDVKSSLRFENPRFMDEAAYIKRLASTYYSPN